MEPLALLLLAQEKNSPAPELAAQDYIDPEKGVETEADALQGANDIVAEMLSDDAEIRKTLRSLLTRQGHLRSLAAVEEDSVYRLYYDFEQPLSKLAGHQILAINRGEKEGFLAVTVLLDRDAALPLMRRAVVKPGSAAMEFIKAACEDALMAHYRRDGFPITIVRPSHTYSDRSVPVGLHGAKGSWQVLRRMQQGKKVIIPGDGTTLWTLTHNEDFARGFLGLMGNPHAIGQSVHITSDERVTWNQAHQAVAAALGVELKAMHVSSEFLDACSPTDLLGPLLGDKSNNAIFDNSKIKELTPGFAAAIGLVGRRPEQAIEKPHGAGDNADRGRRVRPQRADHRRVNVLHQREHKLLHNRGPRQSEHRGNFLPPRRCAALLQQCRKRYHENASCANGRGKGGRRPPLQFPCGPFFKKGPAKKQIVSDMDLFENGENTEFFSRGGFLSRP